jgi:protein-S-isoprenylcysteine O-methyltransferase Ste14
MNDVLNSQSYTQAAWLNRIPLAAWSLMGLIAISCNILIGYSERRRAIQLLLVLPVVVSTSFLLIADIDSPRGGIIRVQPPNLLALSQSLRTQ